MIPRLQTMVLAASLALILGAVIGSTVAVGSSPASAPPDGPTATPRTDPPIDQPATPRAAVRQVKPDFQAPEVTSEMNFVPVAPCRLVDTRLGGGKLAAGTARSFDARGTGSLAAQGGSVTGCGLPLNAAAASMSVVAIKPAAGGYLRGWAQGTTEPETSILNVTKNMTVNGLTIQDLADPHEILDFRIRNGAGAMHLVVDVTGYYIAPMGARVIGDGNLSVGSRVISTAKLNVGQYEVLFDRAVNTCYYSAVSFVGVRDIIVQPRTQTANGVYIEFHDTAGALIDAAFYLTVTC